MNDRTEWHAYLLARLFLSDQVSTSTDSMLQVKHIASRLIAAFDTVSGAR